MAESGNSHNLFIKETLKQFHETESFLRETGLIEFDNVIVMSAEKTEKTFSEADEAQLRYFGKAFYFNVDCCRLAFFIRELIHIYEFRLGKPIIEELLASKVFFKTKYSFDI